MSRVILTDTSSQFHRREYTVKQVKDHLASHGLLVRQYEGTI